MCSAILIKMSKIVEILKYLECFMNNICNIIIEYLHSTHIVTAIP